jgi:cytochrome c oxidase subunit 3
LNWWKNITAKPWEHAGEMDGLHGEVVVVRSAGQTGLWLFLAVVSSMFLLFIVSYYTRSQFPDWEKLTDPNILWVNTGLLLLASVALQLASNAAKRDAASTLRNALIASSLLTVAFVGGQLVAWEQLISAGYYVQGNPSTAFFYLVTGLHAIHLLGGLWYMLLVVIRLNRKQQHEKALKSVALCATYWHYLLLVWLVLFALLLRT